MHAGRGNGASDPVVAIALARQRLGERLRPHQRTGVVLAMCGVVLIAAGS